MNSISESVANQDPRVMHAAREYLASLEAGEQPDRAKYFAQHPEMTSLLRECFDGIDLAHALRPSTSAMMLDSEFASSPLGDFKIVREIGRGGMGIVYEAIQLSLGRRVALKVLPFAAGLDAKHRQRFQTEAQAAAQLHHTNIVPVHAIGIERGVHFYAMQLIDGRSVNAVIHEWKALRGISDRDRETDAKTTLKAQAITTMSPSAPTAAQERERFRTATRIALQVADALEYAHDAGVIHRDIKPANLILDAKGTVWIMDFGLAQIASDVSLTQTGDVLGTLRYMSPEQAAGKRALIDHRTDIYSLGATLYELLTLEPIFAGNDRRTLLQQIFHEEPRSLRKIDKALPLELETIVLKALAKRPAERYASAGELAADLRRYLENKPILARRPTLFDHLNKWIRRHPSIIVFLLILLTLGIAGLAVSTTIINQEHAKQKQRAQEAEDRFQLAQQSADEMIQIADEELSNNSEQQPLRRRLLETALTYYQELIKIRQDDAEARAALKKTYNLIESILADLAVLKAAERHMWLSEAPVQDDLQLTPDQKKSLQAIFRKIQNSDNNPARIDQVSRLKTSEHAQQLLLEMKAHEAAIEAILTQEQLHRLGQIMIQMKGLRAFQDPEVITALNLTREQRVRIRELGEMHPRPLGGERRAFPPHGKKPDGERRLPFDSDRKEMMDRVISLLTPEQQILWRSMIGKPFEGRPDRGPPGDPD